MTLIFDWETTGKASFDLPIQHPSQPRPVQLGAMLFDERRVVRAELSLIVRPEGWVIGEEVSAIHGITNEIALRHGWPLESVVRAFDHLVSRSKVIVSFNFEFDSIDSAVARTLCNRDAEWLGDRLAFCAMKQMMPICKIDKPKWQQAKYGDKYKWPNLDEAWRHCFGDRKREGAHDALADVRTTAEIYFWMLDQTKPTESEANGNTERTPQTDA